MSVGTTWLRVGICNAGRQSFSEKQIVSMEDWMGPRSVLSSIWGSKGVQGRQTGRVFETSANGMIIPPVSCPPFVSKNII